MIQYRCIRFQRDFFIKFRNLAKKTNNSWTILENLKQQNMSTSSYPINITEKASSTKTMPSNNLADWTRLVWVECEMTGLDTKIDTLLEVAVIITDGDLNTIAEGPNIVIHHPEEVLTSMNEWCIQHHGRSGLSKKVRESTISLEEAEDKVVSFVKQWTPEKKCPLAGNSVGQDAKFLEKYMPKLINHLHYRIIDVSTIKELSRRWYPEEFAMAPKKRMTHRALDDIKESIEELRYYRKKLFK